MCRKVLAMVSQYIPSFPYQHVTSFHIQVGYAFCFFLISATILFFGFFGRVCYDFNRGYDPKDFCAKFRSEIFATGLVTFVATLIVFVTSYFRGRMPYEIFYLSHFFVFVMFLFATIHTFDDVARNGQVRSQNLAWFGTSMAIYMADRLWAATSKRSCRVIEAVPTEDGTALALTIERPHGFEFHPGQYAQICVPGIDRFWHPFSIASAPEVRHLKFLIKANVDSPASWTCALMSKQWLDKMLSGQALVHVRGPYGYAVADLKKSDAVLAIGSGTGVVPMLSLMDERLITMSRVGRDALVKAVTVRSSDMDKGATPTEVARRRSEDGVDDNLLAAITAVQLGFRQNRLKAQGVDSSYYKKLRFNAFAERLHALADFIGFLLILAIVIVLGISLSWCNLPEVAARRWQAYVTQISSAAVLGVVCLHLVYRLCFPARFRRGFFTIVEVMVMGVALTLVVFWWLDGIHNYATPTGLQLLLRVVIWLFFMARLYYASPTLRDASYRATLRRHNILGAQTYKLIWVTRSADLVLCHLPALMAKIDEVHHSIYGRAAEPGTWEQSLGRFVDFTIYVTDKNVERIHKLKDLAAGSLAEGKICFCRPNLHEEITKFTQRQLIDQIDAGKDAPGIITDVTFCGAPNIAMQAHHAVHASNIISAALGYPHCRTLFREEFYGFSPPVRKTQVKTLPTEKHTQPEC